MFYKYIQLFSIKSFMRIVTSLDVDIDKWLAQVYPSFIIGINENRTNFLYNLYEVLTDPQIAWQIGIYLCIHNLFIIIILLTSNRVGQQNVKIQRSLWNWNKIQMNWSLNFSIYRDVFLKYLWMILHVYDISYSFSGSKTLLFNSEAIDFLTKVSP